MKRRRAWPLFSACPSSCSLLWTWLLCGAVITISRSSVVGAVDTTSTQTHATPGVKMANETAAAVDAQKKLKDRIDDITNLIEWVKGYKGGYIHPSLEFRQATPTRFHAGDDIGLGVFAKERIEMGKHLTIVPIETMITANMRQDYENEDAELPCSIIHQILKEYRKRGRSQKKPFIDYLMNLETPSIPSSWTDGGKLLLQEMMSSTGLTHPTEAVEWIETEWLEGCEGEESTEAFHAVALSVAHGTDFALPPVIDLFNHATGAKVNAIVAAFVGPMYHVTTTRVINAGEEIFLSYTDCSVCTEDFRTPDIFRDFGFIEDYPQHWHFPVQAEQLHHFDFRIHNTAACDPARAEEDNETGPESDGIDGSRCEAQASTFRIEWMEGKATIEARNALKDQLERLVQYRIDHLSDGPESWAKAKSHDTNMPAREWETVISFVDAMILAVGNALYDTDKEIRGSEGTLENGGVDAVPIQHYGCLSDVSAWCLRNMDLTSAGGGPHAGGRAQDTNDTRQVSDLDAVNAIVEWVTASDTGFYNRKQEIRQNTTHGSGLGVYASEHISRGATLAIIPESKVISATSHRLHIPAEEIRGRVLPCETVQKLIHEMRLGDQSSFAPYVNYLKTVEKPSIPSTWSKEARDLLQEALAGKQIGSRFSPRHAVDFFERAWGTHCQGGSTDAEHHAALMALTRAENENLVPLYDFYNHHNDAAHRNVGVKLVDGVGYEIFAKRPIRAGEQLFVSYSDSPSLDLQGWDSYGTPELFRDYGFIEDFPQTWAIYLDASWIHKIVIQIDKNENSTGTGDGYSITFGEGLSKMAESSTFRDYLLRLSRFRLDVLGAGRESFALLRQSDAVIPHHEWDTLVHYVESAIFAMGHALKAREEMSPAAPNKYEDFYACGNVHDVSCLSRRLYPSLRAFIELPAEREDTCDLSVIMSLGEYTLLDDIHTEYQHVTFYQDIEDDDASYEKDSDICMQLDNIMQICDSYRPHYHEYAINYAARYLKEVKRVAFIGGGDNMILQEFLKYPDLELVVGLELDQTVVRNAFKWFHTEPSFHDDRVEWWFGDATKSLLLLPKGYINSFDLVMVDVSETGASLTVTDHLDILNAMALLVKPDGIMIKNEPYFRQLSRTFDYSVDVHFYDCPMICEQSMIMGSNQIDFYHTDDLVDHGVDNLLLPDLEDYPHQYLLWRDYKVNDAIKDGACAKLDQAIEDEHKNGKTRSGKSEGVVMIIEVEQCDPTIEQLEATLITTLEGLKYTLQPSNNGSANNSEFIIVMAEGYVVARPWAEEKYVALDIHLWGRFERMDATRAALVEALGNGKGNKERSVSSFRVVVSGMYGNGSWEEDVRQIGPDLTAHSRNCVDDTISAPGGSEEIKDNAAGLDTVNILGAIAVEDVIEAGLVSITQSMVSPDSAVVVFCGKREDGECQAATALRHDGHVKHVIVLHLCQSVRKGMFGDGLDLEGMDQCRKTLQQQLLSERKQLGSTVIDGVVLDSSAPYAMARIFAGLWGTRQTGFQPETIHLFTAVLPNNKADEWRRNAIVEIARGIGIDPLTRTELLVQRKGARRYDARLEFSVLAVDCIDAFMRVRRVEDKLVEVFGDHLEVRPSIIEGGELMFKELHQHKPVAFKQSDYDLSSGIRQLKEQHPIGRQSIIQFVRATASHSESTGSNGTNRSSPNIESIVSEAAEEVQYTPSSTTTHSGMGDGAVVVSQFKLGHIVAVWDGRDHITINLFSMSQEKRKADDFVEAFIAATGGTWHKELRDDMPRGYNKVVNFAADLSSVKLQGL